MLHRDGLTSFFWLCLLCVPKVERVDVSGVTPGALANCGLLVASLKGDNSVIVDVNMVVMVGEVDGRLMRRVYNPLE